MKSLRGWGRKAVLRGGVAAVLTILMVSVAQAATVYERPPNPAGGLLLSSWVDPEGSDSDQYAYDSFVLGADRSITEIRWCGGYVNGGSLPNGTKDPVVNFRVTIYASIAGDYQPYCGNPHATETIFLADYWTNSNAGETLAGNYGGKDIYDYAFVLPEPFAAKAGVKYWLKVEGSQTYYPDWAMAAATGGDGQHFHFYSGSMRFAWGTGDTSFSLIAPGPDPYTLTDVSQALRICAGLTACTVDDLARLNAVAEGDSASVIDYADAARIARMAAGTDPNL